MSISMHAVRKVRQNQQLDVGTCGQKTPATDKGAAGAHGFTVPPFSKPGWLDEHVSEQLQSYSSKMMKAIWGQYNRYSVHNLKSQKLPQPSSAPAAAASSAGGSAGIAAALINSN